MNEVVCCCVSVSLNRSYLERNNSGATANVLSPMMSRQPFQTSLYGEGAARGQTLGTTGGRVTWRQRMMTLDVPPPLPTLKALPAVLAKGYSHSVNK